jgi:sulfoxide reductase heme-binding subunit YedZ
MAAGAAARLALWLGGLAPLCIETWRAATGGLGAQLHATAVLGDWSLRFLIAVLAAPLLARLLRRPGLARIRRDLGLLALVYALAHLPAYVVVTQAWRWPLAAVRDRPDFLPAVVALALMLAAGAASAGFVRRRWSEAAVSRARRWSAAAAPLAVLHYAMPVGLDSIEPYAYGAVVAALLAARSFGRVP